MNTGTVELVQYFCANTLLKTFNGGWTPLTPSGHASGVIPKWLWRIRNLVVNLTSRVPVNYYYWHVSSVSIALSSNILTGLLVDCCCESVSSAVFQLFVFFGGVSSLNFAGMQQSSRILIGRGEAPVVTEGDGTTMATRIGPCRGAAAKIEFGEF